MGFDMMRRVLLAAMLAWASGAAATAFNGSAQLDTSLLADPFEIAFVLTDGSGSDDGNTTVTLGNFAFGGGSAGGVDTAFTTGEASGSLDTGLSLRDSAFVTIIASTFTPGAALSFDFEVDWTAEAGGTPDLLAFVLLGSDGTPIATTDPSGADALMTIETGVASTPLVRTFTGDLTPAPLVVTRSVAEPGTIWMLLVAMIASVNARKRSRKGHAMTLGKALWTLVFLSIAFAATGQALKQRKTGLWELQYTAEGPAMQAEQERFQKELASMPPEKRARVEALMKQRGIGPGGAPAGQMRFCLTAEDLAEQSSSSYLKGLNDESNCKSKILSESANEVRIHATCRNRQGGTREVDTRVYDLSPDHYAVDVRSRETGNDLYMQQKARWLGSDCKGAF